MNREGGMLEMLQQEKGTSESDNDDNDCEPSVQDTNKSADVTKVCEETDMKENNSDSFVKIDTKKSGDVPNMLVEKQL